MSPIRLPREAVWLARLLRLHHGGRINHLGQDCRRRARLRLRPLALRHVRIGDPQRRLMPRRCRRRLCGGGKCLRGDGVWRIGKRTVSVGMGHGIAVINRRIPGEIRHLDVEAPAPRPIAIAASISAAAVVPKVRQRPLSGRGKSPRPKTTRNTPTTQSLLRMTVASRGPFTGSGRKDRGTIDYRPIVCRRPVTWKTREAGKSREAWMVWQEDVPPISNP